MAARGPYGVGVRTLEMVDTSRPTEPNREFEGSPQREMTVDVWYPTAAGSVDGSERPLEAAEAPYPLIIFVHGYSSIRNQSASYLQHLASHGYVVASPGFPQTRLDTPGGPRLYAVLDQPADVSFVIDELLAMNDEPSSLLSDAIDGEWIGVTGHSGGGLTTMITAYGERRDDRVDAIVPISPVGCTLPADIADRVTVPAMVIGGSVDRLVGPVSIYDAYEAASAPKYFVDVIGGDHVRFGDFASSDIELGDQVLEILSRGDIIPDLIRFTESVGGDPAACLDRAFGDEELISADRQREILRTAALPFFDAYLKQDEAALRFLNETLPSLPDIRFESEAATEGVE